MELLEEKEFNAGFIILKCEYYKKESHSMKVHKRRKSIIIFCIVILAIAVITYIAIMIAHSIVFSRADYEKYDMVHYITYEDCDKQQYPREELSITSGENDLVGYLYGQESGKGLIIISPGHRDASDIKLYEILFFVDQGWSVLCFDYTGCYGSQGENMIGYIQAVKDLDAVLTYVENEERFQNMPLFLFGHSLGGYATAAVLQEGHDVDAAIIASGFDMPIEQWEYSIERYTGILRGITSKYARLFMELRFGDEAYISAVDGINSVDIPVLMISGTEDEYYGGPSPIYDKREEISNPNCTCILLEGEGHYDYFLSAEALNYQKTLEDSDEIDKWLYMEHDTQFMQELSDFFEKNAE